MKAPTVEVARHGIFTIPKAIRDANNIQEGQRYSVYDLGEGVLLFSPRASQIDAMCDALRDTLLARGASLEKMLEEMRRVREREDG